MAPVEDVTKGMRRGPLGSDLWVRGVREIATELRTIVRGVESEGKSLIDCCCAAEVAEIQ